MPLKIFFAMGGTLAVIAIAAAACQKSEDRPPYLDDEGDSGATPPPGGGGRRDGGGSDGSLAADVDSGCVELADNGALVNEQGIGEALPPTLGGTIAPGTYNLTGANVYTGVGGLSGPTGQQYEETIAFDLTTFNDVLIIGNVDAGLSDPVYASGTYATVATKLTASTDCPINTTSVYTYSVIGSTIHMFQGTSEKIYTLQ
jgi:hypothetical protein